MTDTTKDVPVTPFRVDVLTLSELVRWPRNPKDHDIGALLQSFNRFGYVNPILVNGANDTILAGHGRLDSLWESYRNGESPPERITVRDDGEWLIPVLIVDLDPSLHEAYIVADNRLTELGGWEFGVLAELLTDHKDNLLGIGFDLDDLDDVLTMAGKLDPPPGIGDGSGDDDPSALWPTIAVRVPPDVFRMWQDMVRQDNRTEMDVMCRLIRGG